MRIGVLTTSYPRESGDPAGHFVAGFSHWLKDHVGDVEVIAASDRWPIFYRGGAPSALSSPIRWPQAAAFSAQLFAAAKKRAAEWDAIVSHWLVPCGVVGASLARGRDHLMIAHGSDVRILSRLPGGTRLMRGLGDRGDLVFVADALRPAGVRSRVQRMGIPRENESLSVSTSRSPNSSLRVLFLGRLSHEKGLDLAISALPAGVELIVAGEGPERAALERRANNSVVRAAIHFRGEIRGAEKMRELAHADLLIVPSREDGAPTVIAEAQAIGLPVLATSVGGIPECLTASDRSCEPNIESLRGALEAARDQRQSGGENRPTSDLLGWETIGPKLWAGRQARTQCARLNVVRV